MMPENYIPRLWEPEAALRRKSVLLFGPRQTGKSYLIRRALPRAKVYNLLDNDVFLRLSRRPAILREELTEDDEVVVIDEIQKLPALLDEVQLLIEERGKRFLLTGSSARKLRRGGANLLGGRCATATLHPLVSAEIPGLNLARALQFGTLPSIHLSPEPEADLADYVGTYLREEVAAEGLTRNIPAFSRFLEVAAFCNGQQINYAKISNDAQVARSTVQDYFEILKDTLLAYELPAWQRSVKRKPVQAHKFYFFDVGVARSLRGGGPLQEKSAEFGAALEAFIFHELRAYADYRGSRGENLHYWRSKSGYEVDFVLAGRTAVEVKSSRTVSSQDLKGLRALAEEGTLRDFVCVSLEPHPRRVAGIDVVPWRLFLERLWVDLYA